MLTRKKEISELVFTLINSTCTYTASRIENEKNRFAYVRAMGRCLNLCQSRPNRYDTDRMIKELKKLRVEAPKTFNKWSIELFSNSKGYYMMGVQQALEVVESIHVRFEKGYSSNDEYFVRNILGGFPREN